MNCRRTYAYFSRAQESGLNSGWDAMGTPPAFLMFELDIYDLIMNPGVNTTLDLPMFLS